MGRSAATAKPIGAHPILGCPFAMYQISSVTQMKALTGATRSHEAPLTPVIEGGVSLTEPGVAPTPGDIQVGSLAPSRRSLEQRRSESLDQSAMTPATFVDRVGGSFGASSGASPGTTEATDLLESVNIGGVQIEFVGGSLEGCSARKASVVQAAKLFRLKDRILSRALSFLRFLYL